uniref:Uncharacterized protein n=1 Tax=Ananas comosus var. bracteatus TaxID=296719 RepID=A0A6V7PER5_ANACO|nr:unnamed protein product [Ananas comosus var. bracteatus]
MRKRSSLARVEFLCILDNVKDWLLIGVEVLSSATAHPYRLQKSLESFYSRGPVPDRRDRSPSEQCCAAGEVTGPWQSRPVPERVCAGRDRSRAGRDRFPNVGFSGQAERPVPGRGDRSSGRKLPRPG